eukprot:745870-Hanusia_phi.AAC.2
MTFDRDIWQSKIKLEEKKKPNDRTSLESFFHNYAMEKFLGKSQKAAEWSYNLIQCLQTNSHDTGNGDVGASFHLLLMHSFQDCALFLKILFGDLAEDVYLDEVPRAACVCCKPDQPAAKSDRCLHPACTGCGSG